MLPAAQCRSKDTCADALFFPTPLRQAGDRNAGVDIEGGPPKDLSSEGIYDLFSTKWWSLKLALDAVVTVLRVDQIIMAKQAGGPKAPAGGGGGGDDD